MNLKYRPCVLAVFTNSKGEVLVAERTSPRGAWQFPQGGIDEDEVPVKALYREMGEELGVAKFDIVRQSIAPIRYEFPKNLATPIAQEYCGQEQTWFLTKFHAGEIPSLEKATHKEFIAWEWVSPDEALSRVVPFKREAYVKGLRALSIPFSTKF